MHLLFPASLLISTALALPRRAENTTTWLPGSTAGTDILAKEGLLKLSTYLQTNTTVLGSNGSCTLDNTSKRKEWDTLEPTEKKEWIKAVRCLQTLPAVSADLVPGARTRYDDFVGTHVNQTGWIHNTGNFLAWHRYYIWAFEQALRNECNYTGYQPYANLGRYSNGVIGSPLFDGSDTSISGNGDDGPHGSITLTAPTPKAVNVTIPAMPAGGGCVTNGPFANHTINLGPITILGNDITRPNPQSDGLGYNPRCMRRSLNVVSASGASDANASHLISANNDFDSFLWELNGPLGKGIPQYGVHGSSHFIVGGDPGGDVFTSPGDPFFWLLHTAIDRLWWIWQIQDFGSRVKQIAMTVTAFDIPPSRNTTLDDSIDLGVIGWFKGIRIRDAVDTMGGPFCYIYE